MRKKFQINQNSGLVFTFQSYTESWNKESKPSFKSWFCSFSIHKLLHNCSLHFTNYILNEFTGCCCYNSIMSYTRFFVLSKKGGLKMIEYQNHKDKQSSDKSVVFAIVLFCSREGWVTRRCWDSKPRPKMRKEEGIGRPERCHLS